MTKWTLPGLVNSINTLLDNGCRDLGAVLILLGEEGVKIVGGGSIQQDMIIREHAFNAHLLK